MTNKKPQVVLNGNTVSKQPLCKVCKSPFNRTYTSTQSVCSIICGIKDAATKRHRGKEKQLKLDRKALRERKVALKPLSHWLGLAQTACNAYIRRRDENDGCISCNKPSTWGGQWHASHYRPSGNCSPLRFHPMNIHKACSECNNFKSGNLSEFRIKLW